MPTNLWPLCFFFFIFIVVTFFAPESSSQEKISLFNNEVWNRVNPDFIEQHKFKGDSSDNNVLIEKKVRFIYLVPQDRVVRDDYKAAIADAALHL